MTGPVIIDDVIYESVEDDVSRLFPSKELIFRRLTFQRSTNLVQSEALLTLEECKSAAGQKEHKSSRSSSKSKKKGNQRGNPSNVTVLTGDDSSSFNYRLDSCLCPFSIKVTFVILSELFVTELVVLSAQKVAICC